MFSQSRQGCWTNEGEKVGEEGKREKKGFVLIGTEGN